MRGNQGGNKRDTNSGTIKKIAFCFIFFAHVNKQLLKNENLKTNKCH